MRDGARLRLAWPFTITRDDSSVWMIAGEDIRYALDVGAGSDWVLSLLRACDGSRGRAELIAIAPAEHRGDAEELVDQLLGERVLVEAGAEASHRARRFVAAPVGQGPVARMLEGEAADGVESLPVLCQDRLDYAAALDFNRARLRDGEPWLWCSTGAMARCYVGPLFLPGAGPCLECLLQHFQRLSPAPEVYDLLSESEVEVEAVTVPEPAAAILAALVRWKVALAAEPDPAAALYALHVLEVADLTVGSHELLIEPECPACRPHR